MWPAQPVTDTGALGHGGPLGTAAATEPARAMRPGRRLAGAGLASAWPWAGTAAVARHVLHAAVDIRRLGRGCLFRRGPAWLWRPVPGVRASRHSPAGSTKTCPGCGRRLRICPGPSTSWRWDVADCWRAPSPPTAGFLCGGCARWARLTTARRSRSTRTCCAFSTDTWPCWRAFPAGWRAPPSRACCA